jgi:hypothetical protein
MAFFSGSQPSSIVALQRCPESSYETCYDPTCRAHHASNDRIRLLPHIMIINIEKLMAERPSWTNDDARSRERD